MIMINDYLYLRYYSQTRCTRMLVLKTLILYNSMEFVAFNTIFVVIIESSEVGQLHTIKNGYLKQILPIVRYFVQIFLIICLPKKVKSVSPQIIYNYYINNSHVQIWKMVFTTE
ncbi:Hypothetical_protein [Hexamita inflata]|uniref:Hypothetical_protein n=1 Tax=Hexamita inflata TaxID=28002 RepID=A0ABP1L239_9EUKA